MRLAYPLRFPAIKTRRVGEENMKKAIVYLMFVGLALGGCAARDPDYQGRNNMEYARAECLRLANGSGYSDVAVDSVERDGHAEWKVGLRMRRDGRDRTERCEYNARTDKAHLG